ncbi:MAG: pyridoxal phosphate-dependent aminotransferase [Bacteroidota bacterium]|nr:pyridoxal phosphate-dependent aminotransferase [Bacteroidota bacterium]
MSKKSRELESQGKNVINLSIGQPDFFTPDYIKEAGKKAIDENYSSYPPVSGYADLRAAICRKLKRDNGVDYKPAQIVVSTGAKQSLSNVIYALINPDDEVIVPSPYWVSYKEMIKLAEGNAKFIETTIDSRFKITPEQLEAAITPKTKLFLFSSPSNPTGTIYSKEELRALADVFARHPNIYILSDEIYELINFNGKHESISQFEDIRDRVIIVNGVSKGFAMTGWRLGYIAAPQFIAEACDKLQGQITSATCSISQRASLAAIEADPNTSEDLKKMNVAFLKRRDLVYKLLQEVPGFKSYLPDGAFYFFPDISGLIGRSNGKVTITGASMLCDYILDNVYVALVAGEGFGNPKCIRLSYATSEEKLIEGINRIKTLLADFK